MILADFQAGGRPRTKGSLNAYCMKNRQHTIRVEEDITDSKRWRKVVARACRVWQLDRYAGKFLRYAGPVEVRLVFFFPRDESVNGGPVPTHDTLWPTHITLGDWDKLGRNVSDALSTPRKRAEAEVCSALILDDSQIVKGSIAKFWSTADREPGVQVLVLSVDEPEVELEAVEASWRVDHMVRA